MSLMLIFNRMVRTFPDLQFLKDWHQSSGKKIVHKIRWVEKKSQKKSTPYKGGLFSCFAAARAACVSTWLGELGRFAFGRAAGQATSGNVKRHLYLAALQPRAQHA